MVVADDIIYLLCMLIATANCIVQTQLAP